MAWIVGLVVPTSLEIWLSASSGWNLTSQAIATWAVLAFGKRGIARAFALQLTFGSRVIFQLQLKGRVFLRPLNLSLIKLVIGNRVKPLDPHGDFAIGNPVHFQLVQATEIGDLFEATAWCCPPARRRLLLP